MSRVKFGDVVRDVKVKVDRDNNPYEYYLAGEHFDSERLFIPRRGRFEGSDVGPAFIRIFKPGQVLYGSRRTYLKKVAVADFEGITANTTFVLESKDESFFSQRLLPFIMLSDSFTKWSVGHSKGSTNPYVLFSDLAEYEFELPPIETQRRLSDLLCEGESLKEVYRRLLVACDEVVKSRFVETFGDPVRGESRYERIPIGQLAQVSSGATPSRKRPDYYEGTIPWVKTGEVASGDVYATEEHISQEAVDNSACHILPAETVLVAMYGQGDTRGKASILRISATTNQACAALEFGKRVIPQFALTHLHLCYEDLRGLSRGGNQKNLSLQIIKAYELIVPPIELQQEFASFVAQVDKSEFALKQAIESVSATMSAILNQELGMSDVQ